MFNRREIVGWQKRLIYLNGAELETNNRQVTLSNTSDSMSLNFWSPKSTPFTIRFHSPQLLE